VKRRLSPDAVEGALSALEAMDGKALRERWREVYGTEPPPKIKSGLLRLAVAYRIQERAFGGLKPASKRLMQARAEAARTGSAEAINPTRRIPRRLTPGTQLMREWNGTTQLIDVLDDGFRWKDKTYRTLSAVAVAITGTKWSGPKFFGLTSDAGPSKSSEGATADD